MYWSVKSRIQENSGPFDYSGTAPYYHFTSLKYDIGLCMKTKIAVIGMYIIVVVWSENEVIFGMLTVKSISKLRTLEMN